MAARGRTTAPCTDPSGRTGWKTSARPSGAGRRAPVAATAWEDAVQEHTAGLRGAPGSGHLRVSAEQLRVPTEFPVCHGSKVSSSPNWLKSAPLYVQIFVTACTNMVATICTSNTRGPLTPWVLSRVMRFRNVSRNGQNQNVIVPEQGFDEIHSFRGCKRGCNSLGAGKRPKRIPSGSARKGRSTHGLGPPARPWPRYYEGRLERLRTREHWHLRRTNRCRSS